MIEVSPDKEGKSRSEIMFVWRGINLTMTVFFLLATYVNVSFAIKARVFRFLGFPTPTTLNFWLLETK